MVVNDSSPLPILTLVALETVQSWLPQVLLAELEVGVHRSVRVGSAVTPCCLPEVNNKPSSRQVTGVRQSNAGSGCRRQLAHSSCQRADQCLCLCFVSIVTLQEGAAGVREM